ncbi:MAG: glycine zipper family protein [Gammaproteobacteria bacterium]|nr:glycine zipper family protein [Gammaproteobacteria bacterium]
MSIFKILNVYSVLTTVLIISVGITNTAMAQQMGGGAFAYPDAGQSKEQLDKDTFECHNWAATQTGFDPNRTPYPRNQSYSYAQAQEQGYGFGSGDIGRGGAIGDGARGAAAGAAIGAISGNAKKGAMYGAATGALFGGMRRAKRKQEEKRFNQQQRAHAQQQQAADSRLYDQAADGFRRAYGICMSSRDYRVQ